MYQMLRRTTSSRLSFKFKAGRRAWRAAGSDVARRRLDGQNPAGSYVPRGHIYERQTLRRTITEESGRMSVVFTISDGMERLVQERNAPRFGGLE